MSRLDSLGACPRCGADAPQGFSFSALVCRADVPENLHSIARLFDGNKSLYDVASLLSSVLNSEQDPLHFTYGFVQEFFFEQ